MRPRIAIPVPHTDPSYSECSLPQYKSAVERSGGEPVEISLTASTPEIAQVVKTCDAILLPGSPADVDPQKFGAATRHPKTSPSDPPRDNVDELLLQDAHNMRKPILGICYGLQSLNVWRQGTLIQHLETPVLHSRPDDVPRTVQMRHEAVVESASLLGDILGRALHKTGEQSVHLEINSSHHQAIETPGDALRVVARSAPDNVIEAVEGTNPDHWVIGVQWHPERSFDEDEPSKAIFVSLVEAARKWHERARQNADFETVRR